MRDGKMFLEANDIAPLPADVDDFYERIHALRVDHAEAITEHRTTCAGFFAEQEDAQFDPLQSAYLTPAAGFDTSVYLRCTDCGTRLEERQSVG